MVRTNLSLRSFMPYGAPDLIDGAGPRWVRSVALGSLLWAVVFSALTVSGLLDRKAVPPSIPRSWIDLVPPRILVPERIASPGSRPRAAKRGAFAPVAREPKVDEVPVVAEPNGIDFGEGPIESGPAEVGDAAPIPAGARIEPAPFDLEQTVLLDEPAVAVHIVEPRYPDLAQRAGVEGLVVLKVLVARDGSVTRVEVLRSIPILDAAAREALARWVFKPAWHEGRPVSVWVAVPVRFSLH